MVCDCCGFFCCFWWCFIWVSNMIFFLLSFLEVIFCVLNRYDMGIISGILVMLYW